MARKLYQMEVCEWYFEWWLHGARIVEHAAWYDNRRKIISIRLAMRNGNFYRLQLSDDNEVVVSENHLITVEVY